MKNATLPELAAGSLLDRLSNRSNDQVAEATISRGELTATDMRESIVRNLTWILETTYMEESVDLSRWPNVRNSVLNFGVPEFTGLLVSDVDCFTIEQKIGKAIRLFEPRLFKETLEVKMISDEMVMERRSLKLLICGDCFDGAAQHHIRVTAELDPESGRITKVLR